MKAHNPSKKSPTLILPKISKKNPTQETPTKLSTFLSPPSSNSKNSAPNDPPDRVIALMDVNHMKFTQLIELFVGDHFKHENQFTLGYKQYSSTA